MVEGRQRQQSVAPGSAGIERREPLIVGVLTGKRGAMLVGFRQRFGVEAGARAHGAAIRAAATGRSSARMTL